MADHAAQSIVFSNNGFSVDRDAELLFKVAKGPEVVIAQMEMDRNSSVGDPCDGPKQADRPFGNSVTVIKPKIEEVPDQMDFSRRSLLGVALSGGGVFQPLHKLKLSNAAFDRVRSTQMQIRGEVNALQMARLWKQLLQLSDQGTTP